jgi:hypothetical protein
MAAYGAGVLGQSSFAGVEEGGDAFKNAIWRFLLGTSGGVYRGPSSSSYVQIRRLP